MVTPPPPGDATCMKRFVRTRAVHLFHQCIEFVCCAPTAYSGPRNGYSFHSLLSLGVTLVDQPTDRTRTPTGGRRRISFHSSIKPPLASYPKPLVICVSRARSAQKRLLSMEITGFRNFAHTNCFVGSGLVCSARLNFQYDSLAFGHANPFFQTYY